MVPQSKERSFFLTHPCHPRVKTHCIASHTEGESLSLQTCVTVVSTRIRTVLYWPIGS